MAGDWNYLRWTQPNWIVAAEEQFAGSVFDKTSLQYIAKRQAVEFEVLEVAVTQDIISQVVRQVRGQTRKMFKEYAQYMFQSSSKRENLDRVNRLTAMGALETAKEAYIATHGKGASYRYGEANRLYRRYSGGLMLAALSDYRVVEWGYNGFNLYDAARLDRYARQWYRLNFGAGPKVTPGIEYGVMEFGGQPTRFGLTLSQYPESRPFAIPYGFWSRVASANNDVGIESAIKPGAGRGDPFYVLGKKKQSSDLAWLRIEQGKNARARGKLARSGLGIREINKRAPVPTLVSRYPNASAPPQRSTISSGILGTRFLDEGVVWANRFYGTALTETVTKWHQDATTKANRSIGRMTR